MSYPIGPRRSSIATCSSQFVPDDSVITGACSGRSKCPTIGPIETARWPLHGCALFVACRRLHQQWLSITLTGVASIHVGAFRHIQSTPPDHREGAQMGSADAASFAPAAPSGGGRMIDRVRAVSTPAALWLVLGVLVVGLLAFGAVGVRVVTDRQAAIETVRSEGAPLVTATESLYVALADADAAASTAFLQAGLEPQDLRDRYDADIAQAGRELSEIGRSDVLPDDAHDSLATLNERLPHIRRIHRVGADQQSPGLPGGCRLPAAGVRRDAARAAPRRDQPVQGVGSPPRSWPSIWFAARRRKSQSSWQVSSSSH